VKTYGKVPNLINLWNVWLWVVIFTSWPLCPRNTFHRKLRECRAEWTLLTTEQFLPLQEIKPRSPFVKKSCI